MTLLGRCKSGSLPTPNSWQGPENRSFYWCCPKLGIPKLAILFGKVSDDKLSDKAISVISFHTIYSIYQSSTSVSCRKEE